MAKRYYYTDPLAAAWMAREFGMRFDSSTTTFLPVWSAKALVGSIEGKYKGYIHPDSEHLLEPMAGE